MMQEFIVSEAWKAAYPQAVIGVLALHGVANPERHATLDQRKTELEGQLRGRYATHDRAALKELPVLQAYNAYYKLFKKTYHVQLQLESVVFKGKSIPRVAALVEAMFMAELEDLLLTAGHDLESLQPPIAVYVADGSEQYTRINGQEQTLKAGDMFIADARGVISSVLYGPDQRTRITPGTRQVLFTVYGPAGIGAEAVHEHLAKILANVQLFAPTAMVKSLKVYGTE
jgi:DNA/RNA-binding domain of Phe-tRNA-synthetase-like protein